MSLRFGILGPLEAERGGTAVDLGPPKQKAVLAVLLISANQVLSLDRLIEMLWGDQVPARAHGSLQAYVHNLRKVIEPNRAVRSQAQVLVTRPPGYVLQIAPDELDATRFEFLVAQGHRLLTQAHPAAAKQHLTDAMALWRGAALGEFAFEQFAQPEAARLEQVRAAAHEDLLDAELALGNHAAVIGEITVAVGEHPLRERLWSLLMLALYRSGRQSEALRAFAMARHTLAEELGIDPSPALRSLEAAILAQSAELDDYQLEPWAGEAHARAPTGGQCSAGALSSAALIGREKQLRRVMMTAAEAQIGHGGVVLISGEVGIGKTRLAKEVAAEAESEKFTVGWGRAYEREGAPACWPWIQIVADLVRRASPDRLRQALTGRDEVLHPLLPSAGSSPGEAFDRAADLQSSPSARFALFEAMSGFLTDLADAQPLIVILEDIQWADPLSLQLLEHVAGQCQTSHVLIVATCQPLPNQLDTPLAETLGVLVRLPVFDWVELDGLSCSEAGRLIAQIGARATPAQVSEIHSRTDGNPFFVSTFARLLATRDIPRPSLGGLIPNSVRAVIGRRLSHLPEETRDVLAVAASLGRDFDIRNVATAAEVNLNDAVKWVHAAVVSGVVSEDLTSPGSYRFCQGMVRETLRDELDVLRRGTLREVVMRTGRERDESIVHQSDHQEESCRQQ